MDRYMDDAVVHDKTVLITRVEEEASGAFATRSLCPTADRQFVASYANGYFFRHPTLETEERNRSDPWQVIDKSKESPTSFVTSDSTARSIELLTELRAASSRVGKSIVTLICPTYWYELKFVVTLGIRSPTVSRPSNVPLGTSMGENATSAIGLGNPVDLFLGDSVGPVSIMEFVANDASIAGTRSGSDDKSQPRVLHELRPFPCAPVTIGVR